MRQLLLFPCHTCGTLHWNAAAKKEPKPHVRKTATRVSPVFLSAAIGANARRNKIIEILTRIVVSMKRRLET